MAQHSEQFVAYLQNLQMQNRGAMAALRHSLAFDPGSDRRIYSLVEQFAGNETAADAPRRLALYAVAGLFAQHPIQASQTFAAAFGKLSALHESASIEKRFVALLEANSGSIVTHLRQALNLLSAEDIGFDYARLLDDLSQWLAPTEKQSTLQTIRQRWMRDFYRAALDGVEVKTDSASFVSHLVELAEFDRAALATLRQSLTFAPGNFSKACPLVEPFVDPKWPIFDARRRARYLVAGIFALNPNVSDTQSLPAALGQVARRRDSDSIEARFVALLGATTDTVADHLRQAVRLVAADKTTYNPAWLLSDLSVWLNPRSEQARMDHLRQCWARDFYRVTNLNDESPTSNLHTEGA